MFTESQILLYACCITHNYVLKQFTFYIVPIMGRADTGYYVGSSIMYPVHNTDAVDKGTALLVEEMKPCGGI